MPTGRAIVKNGIMRESDLVVAVKEGRITAFDKNTLRPIDWDKLENLFTNLLTLSIEKKLKKQPNFLIIDDIRCDSTTGVKGKVDRVPWDIFIGDLTVPKEEETVVPLSQQKEFLDGWGATIMKPYVLDAYYKQEELGSLFIQAKPAYLDRDNPYYSPELAAMVETWLEAYEHKTLLDVSATNQECRDKITERLVRDQDNFDSEQSKDTSDKGLLPTILCGYRHRIIKELKENADGK